MRVQTIDIQLTPATRGEAARILSGLQPGDAVQAELTAVSGSRIQFKTGDGKIIQADFRGSIQFQPGDILELALSSREGSRISLRLLSLNGQPVRLDVSAQENLLLRAGIDPSALNVRLSGILQENGFLPTVQNLSNLARIVQEQPNLPAELSAFLAANHLRPDEQTLGRINQLISAAPQTGTRAEQLTAAFTQLLAELKTAPGFQTGENTAPGASSPPPSQIDAHPAQTISDGMNISGFSEAKAGSNTAATADAAQILRLISSFAGSDGSLVSAEDWLPGAARPDGQPVRTQQTGSLPELIRHLASLPEQEARHTLAALSSRDPQNAKMFSALLSVLNLPVQERQSLIRSLPGLAGENLGWITGNAQIADPALIQDASLRESNPGAAQNGPQGQAGILSEAASESARAAQPAPALEAAGQLLRKLDGLFLHLNPDDIPSVAAELRETVINQEKLAESIGSDISRFAGERSVLARQAGELHAQVQFTSGLEQFFYFQIPVRFENRSSTAELYVFERSGREKNNRDINTILIALETQNLGRIETVLRCEGSGLDIQFKLQSATLSNYLQDKSSELKNALAESGFQVKSLQFGLIEKKTTLLNAQELFSKESRFPAVGLDIQI